MRLADASTVADYRTARTLFEAYARSLAVDLSYQRFDEELMKIETLYGPPRGALLLALEDGRPLGCIAVRELDDDVCEMKRLYVVPAARGRGLGRLLAEAAIRRATALGYHLMRLDTLTSMTSAAGLYRSLGFREIAPYYETPHPTLFFELPLDEGDDR